MRLFLLNILLALAWVALTGQITSANFVAGFAISYFALWLIQPPSEATNYFSKVRQAGAFIIFFGWEMIKANVRVAYEVVTPGHQMTPGVVAVPLDVKSEAEITLLANLITLTPGTLSLDVSADRRTLYVHAMYIDDVESFVANIKQGFEYRVRELLQ